MTDPAKTGAIDLAQFPIHLGMPATAVAQPAFSGDMQWYMDYASRHASDAEHGRLVALHTFSQSWDSWEMHPSGSEVVLCVAGAITLVQQLDDASTVQVPLNAGQYAINPPGVWHTADVSVETTVLFITAGAGTEHKAR